MKTSKAELDLVKALNQLLLSRLRARDADARVDAAEYALSAARSSASSVSCARSEAAQASEAWMEHHTR